MATRTTSSPGLRVWYAATATAVAVALVLEIVIALDPTDPRFDTAAGRVANLFTYFTIGSNLLVGAASARAATGGEPRGPWSRAVWAAALLCIAVTAVVWHVVLAGAGDAPILWAVANALLHTWVPFLFVVGWVVLGPRGVVRVRSVLRSLVFPLGWLAFTLARGALTGYYPYPFLEAARLGPAAVAGNVALVAALYLGLAVVLGLVDATRPRW